MPRHAHHELTAVSCLLVCLASACQARPSSRPTLSAADSTAIRELQSAYVSAWLADDTAAVLATLADSAVLMPPGASPRVGIDAIREYWWPHDGSRTRITAFTWTIDELRGQSPLAYTRGTSTLAWTYDKDTVHQASSAVGSVNVTVLTRQSTGTWRISHQMWGPPLKR